MQSRAAVFVIALAGACGSKTATPPPTQVDVVVQVDTALGLDGAKITATASGRMAATRAFAVTSTTTSLEWLILIPNPAGGFDATVSAEGDAGGAPSVTYAAHVTVVSGQTVHVVLKLSASCVGVPACGSGSQCEEGHCAPVPTFGPTVDGGADASAGSDGGGADGAGGDGGPTCTDVVSSSDNCGVCGHSCGGGSCSLGACQPVVLAGVTANSIAVDATQIYFTTGNKVLACPKGGCVVQPTQLDDMGVNGYPTGGVVVMNNTLFFAGAPTQTTERPAIFQCPLSGCPSPPPVVFNGGLMEAVWLTGAINGPNVDAYIFGGRNVFLFSCQPNGAGCGASQQVLADSSVTTLAARTDEFYFVDTLGLQKCPVAGCPVTDGGTGATLLTAQVPTNILYFGGLIYMQFGNPNGFASGAIKTCNPVDCDAHTPKNFITGRDVFGGLSVDASGVYWIEDSTLYSCPISGCVGGAHSMATNIMGPNPSVAGTYQTVTDDTFVYWIDDPTGTVKRVAK